MEIAEGVEPIGMQQSGGLLLTPVRTLVATLIFAIGENAYRLPDPYYRHRRKCISTPGSLLSPSAKMHIDSRILLLENDIRSRRTGNLSLKNTVFYGKIRAKEVLFCDIRKLQKY